MKNYKNYLKNNLNLCGYSVLNINASKMVIFKTFFKYTKCVYITLTDINIYVKVDKVFDTEIYPSYIERLLISSRTFNNIDESLSYIQKSLVV